MSALYIMCMPLQMVSLFAGFSVLRAISLVLAPVLLATLIFGKKQYSFNSVHLFFALYVIYTIAAMFISRDEGTMKMLQALLQNAMIIVLVSMRVYNEREEKIFEYAWLMVGVVCIYIGLFSSVEMQNNTGRQAIVFFGSYEDPNQFCAYFVLSILYAMKRVIHKHKLAILYVVYILVLFYVVFKMGSRGGLLGILAAVFVYGIFSISGFVNKMKVISLMLVAALIIVGVVFPLVPQSVQDRFSVSQVVEDKGSGRFDLWAITFNAITKDWRSILFGNGIYSTTWILKKAGSHAGFAHNHWLQLWCDQGLIAVIIFGVLFVCAGFRNRKRDPAVMAAVFSMLVFSMSLTMGSFKPFLNIIMMSAFTYEKGGVGGDDHRDNPRI